MKSEFYRPAFDVKFYPEEVTELKEMWNSGSSLPQIANRLGREVEEAFILALDLASKGAINERSGGLWGNCNVQN